MRSRNAANACFRRLAANFQGTAKLSKTRSKNMGILLTVAIMVVYIVLGVLYESYVHPAHDSFGTAVGGLRGAADADDLSTWI